MKKILFAGMVAFGSMAMIACDNNGEAVVTEDEGVVVDRDSVATEYEVTETVVEYDTTTRTKSVDVDRDSDRDNN
ncbi:putative lipoprotein NlpE involved in copper resistance [Pontibacter aydingkolensis]|uniref:YgdI/YgdR family lipoprotein n=1 Tax=Pontibacter aydingkolensis TaxID=1911536 RepID=A0ABS7CX15_9BACT|nr:hypothetical protein [Pontibacter aydingkolensis]MBW7468411.1 hypothetical protein [Pontibacter aydingkolensis]